MYSGKYWCFSGGGSSSQVCDRMFHSERKPLHSPAVSKLELPSSHAEGTLSTPAQNSLFHPHWEQTEKLTLQPVSAVYELGQPLIFKTAAGMLICCWLLCGSASVKKKKKLNQKPSDVSKQHAWYSYLPKWLIFLYRRTAKGKNVKTSIYKTLSQPSLSHITFAKRDTFIVSLSLGIRLLQQQFSPHVTSGGVFRSDKVSLKLH